MNEQSTLYSNEMEKFYNLLDQSISNAGGLKSLDCNDYLDHLPKQGVEFYFRDNDYRDDSKDRLRVVQVGISKRLNGRVPDHLNLSPLNSIFRDHLTIAIAHKEEVLNITSGSCSAIAKSIIQQRPEISKIVDEEFRKHHIFCLPVNEEKDRDNIKQNVVALLSWHAYETIDIPPDTWLGKFHHNPKIQASGLWNIHFVWGNNCPSDFKLMHELTVEVLNDNSN